MKRLVIYACVIAVSVTILTKLLQPSPIMELREWSVARSKWEKGQGSPPPGMMKPYHAEPMPHVFIRD